MQNACVRLHGTLLPYIVAGSAITSGGQLISHFGETVNLERRAQCVRQTVKEKNAKGAADGSRFGCGKRRRTEKMGLTSGPRSEAREITFRIWITQCWCSWLVAVGKLEVPKKALDEETGGERVCVHFDLRISQVASEARAHTESLSDF